MYTILIRVILGFNVHVILLDGDKAATNWHDAMDWAKEKMGIRKVLCIAKFHERDTSV